MLLCIQNINASRFIEDNWHNSSLHGIDANAALTQFAGWLVEQRGQLPNHDQATLFTRLVLRCTVDHGTSIVAVIQ